MQKFEPGTHVRMRTDLEKRDFVLQLYNVQDGIFTVENVEYDQDRALYVYTVQHEQGHVRINESLLELAEEEIQEETILGNVDAADWMHLIEA